MAAPPTAVRPRPTSVPTGDTAGRILAATASCVAAQGLRATSVDDIAREAGCARATVYRLFPAGRTGLLAAAVELEIGAVLEAAASAADSQEDLAGAVAAAVQASCAALASHAALQRLLTEEPGVVLPHISFDNLDPLLARSGAWGVEHLGRFLEPDQAAAVGEWCARVVLAHLRSPGSPTDTTDLVAVRRLVDRHLVPGLPVAGRTR